MSRTAVLFAGGKSSRMGRDKALLPFGGHDSLAAYQHARLLTLFDQVYVVAKAPKFAFKCTLIEDHYEEASPLVALVSVFESLAEEEVFVLSVDAPFVDQVVIERLYHEAKEESDIIVARSPVGREPLCAIYRRTILPHAQKHLAKGNHRLGFLLQSVNTQEVYFDQEEAFMNLNHPHEYEEAYRLSSSI